MKLTLPFIDQIRGTEDSGQVVADDATDQRGTDRRSLGGWIALTLNSLVAAITAGYHTEHNDDDTHKTIHASGSIAERGRTVAMGDWTDVAIAPALFSASGSMTWLGTSASPVVYAYTRIGSTLLVSVWIEGATLTGSASSSLRLALPTGLTITALSTAAMHYTNSTGGVGTFQAVPGTAYLSIWKADFSNWSTAATVSIHGQIAVRV